MILKLAIKSAWARALTVTMTTLAIALSVALFVGVEKVRTGSKNSFSDTISGTDLIIGARSGSVQLLLYSVFRIGNATNNVSWKSFKEIRDLQGVDWAVPISLGDSHRQFRVMGTTRGFFEHYKYRGGRDLQLADGAFFDDLFDTVIGADVAKVLKYQVGSPIVVAHGLQSFTQHDEQPFRVSGVLEKTGTPVDRTVIVSLGAIEAIHVDWQGGGRKPGAATPIEEIRAMDLQPKAITAAFLGTDSPLQIFKLQRAVNQYPNEPLLAILPGVALQELWGIVGVAETALIAVSAMVVATALLGMMAMLLSSLSERRREMSIYRAMGARPRTIFGLLLFEASFITVAGSLLGLLLIYIVLFAIQPLIDAEFGLWIPLTAPTAREALYLLGVTAAGAIVSAIPAIRAYRMSLADGMVVTS